MYKWKILHISNLTKEPVIIGFMFKNKQQLYNKPIRSTKLNIFILNDISNNLLWWKLSDVTKKMIVFNFDNQLIAIPILHT